MVYNDAIKIVTTEINKDSNMQLCYIANIAYAFENEFRLYCKEHRKRHLTKADVHTIATAAAEHYLEMWLMEKTAKK